jgi:hypothetical protein
MIARLRECPSDDDRQLPSEWRKFLHALPTLEALLCGEQMHGVHALRM